MKFYGVLALFVLAAVAVAEEERKDYTNYKLIQVYPKTEAEGLMIADFEINNNDFDIWNSAKKSELFFDVMLSPEAFVKYTTIFNQLQIPYVVAQENMQEVINQEARELAATRMEGRVVNTYPRHNDLLAWMDTVAASNPNIVSQTSAGTSNQGRDLRVLIIKVGSPSRRVWFDCGIHAREWISPATCVSLINKFLDDYNNNVAAAVNILNNYELHFMPSENPDGYEYSQTSERYWRKNRKVNPGSTCVGVDLNRNYPFGWLTGGSSTDRCSDIFAGPSAGSEPETQAVINYIAKYPKWDSFLTIHSYGNWFLTAWGNTTALPPTYSAMKAAGDVFAAGVKKVYGETFTVGSTATLLYIASGASSDWGYGEKNIPHSYTIELRPSNIAAVGLSGFNIAPSQIRFVGDEIYAGIKDFLNHI